MLNYLFNSGSEVCNKVLEKDQYLYSRNYFSLFNYFSDRTEAEYNSIKQDISGNADFADLATGFFGSLGVDYSSFRENSRYLRNIVSQNSLISDSRYQHSAYTNPKAYKYWIECVKQNSIANNNLGYYFRLENVSKNNFQILGCYFNGSEANKDFTFTLTNCKLLDEAGNPINSREVTINFIKEATPKSFIFLKIPPQDLDYKFIVSIATANQTEPIVIEVNPNPQFIIFHSGIVYKQQELQKNQSLISFTVDKQKIDTNKTYKLDYSLNGFFNLNGTGVDPVSEYIAAGTLEGSINNNIINDVSYDSKFEARKEHDANVDFSNVNKDIIVTKEQLLSVMEDSENSITFRIRVSSLFGYAYKHESGTINGVGQTCDKLIVNKGSNFALIEY